MSYTVVERVPSPEKFCELRKRAGLSPRSIESAIAALPLTVFGVSIILDGSSEIIGMGRLVGDRYLNLSVVDMAVLPEHQGKGVGRKMMDALMKWVEASVPEDCYITLIADGNSKYLYEKYKFIPVIPFSIGMYYSRSP